MGDNRYDDVTVSQLGAWVKIWRGFGHSLQFDAESLQASPILEGDRALYGMGRLQAVISGSQQ
jgi:hypothetical protein